MYGRLLVCTAALAITAVSAMADATMAFTYSGTTSSGHPVNVTADFTVDAVTGNMDVTVYNNTTNLAYDTQVLTGIAFTFAGESSVGSLSVINPTVNTYSVNDANGSISLASSNVSPNWITNTSTFAGYVTLTNIGGNGNKGGSQGMLSNTLNDPTNNLSAGGKTWILSGQTFAIAGLGLTSSTQITGVEFNFGTALTTVTGAVTGTIVSTATPEPGTLLTSSLVLGLLAFGGVRKRLRRD